MEEADLQSLLDQFQRYQYLRFRPTLASQRVADQLDF